MQCRHKRTQRAELRDNLVGQIFRMAGGEAQALDTRLVKSFENLSETRAAIQVATIRVDVLTEQRDLLHTGCHITFRFDDDVFDWARFLRPRT